MLMCTGGTKAHVIFIYDLEKEGHLNYKCLSYLIKFRDVSTSQFSSYQRAIEGSSMSYLGWKTDLEKCTMATVLLLLLD